MSELAGDGIPVAVSLRVLKLSRQPYYRWRKHRVTASQLRAAYRANALFDAHRDDPEFGSRFLTVEAHAAGEVMCERTAWRICRDNQWWCRAGFGGGRETGHVLAVARLRLRSAACAGEGGSHRLRG